MDVNASTTLGNANHSAETHMRYCFSLAADAYSGPATIEHLPAGGIQIVTGASHPLGNFALGAADGEIDKVAAHLTATQKPSALLFAGDASEVAQQRMAKHGFGPAGEMPAMAVDIASLDASDLPAGYDLDRLEPGRSEDNWARAWADTFAEGFGIPLELAEVFSPLNVTPAGKDDDPLHFFRVTHGEETVGVSLLALGEGVAGMYCVATVPEHRGKGIGAALTAEPLRRAGKLGYKIGVLQASEMGHPVYRRLGFEDVGKIAMFVRMPA